ncbi:peroxiredoxin [Brevibacterium daeguense]|uniref:Peroxiredoxin n=1 Tax=Brevibacterium daeguense TaxID=909936 RepID=A0ABP8EIY7_9MICO|nr:redoxin domain-containing protein [Brevibacterium daeguense]
MAGLPVGAPAPDFSLSSQHGEELVLSELLQEQRVLLVFYPFAFSPVCGGEMDQLIGLNDRFAEAEISVIGVSVDSKYALQAWSEQKDIPFRLAADFWPHGRVAREYRVFNEDNGMAVRGTFLISQDGAVAATVVNPRTEARDFTEFLPA